MVPLRMLPDQQTLTLTPGTSVLAASLAAGLPLTHACGGDAKCSTCRVAVLEGREHCPTAEAAEAELARRLGFEPGVRLACQLFPRGPVTVRRLVLDATDESLASRPLLAGKPEAVGEEKSMAVLFSDIRGFTRMSRKLLPYDIVHALNRHFEKMGEIIGRHGGVINNVMGDGLMVLFEHGEPADHPALRATRAALEMSHAVETLGRPYFAQAYGTELAIGIGIDYGPVIAGAIGHAESRRMTVIGETVNRASRIESANKQTATTVLVSTPVREACGPVFVWRHFPDIGLAGIGSPLTLHEPSGPGESDT